MARRVLAQCLRLFFIEKLATLRKYSWKEKEMKQKLTKIFYANLILLLMLPGLLIGQTITENENRISTKENSRTKTTVPQFVFDLTELAKNND